jgi:ATP-dependent RNA helicase DeaD
MSSQIFSLEGLHPTPQWQAAFVRDGIHTPTPVQAAAVGPILAGRDVVAYSGTGTGKTLAYLLPLLQRAAEDNGFRILVMAPSPELAIQILRVAETFKLPGTGSVGLVGGGNIERQKDKLKKHPQVMVGTPGRILELVMLKKIKMPTLGAFVLDEADEILSAVNQEPIYDLCGHPNFDAQLICASASFGPASDLFVNQFMRPDHALLRLDAQPLRENIAHIAVPYDPVRKEVELIRLVDRLRVDRALVFVNRLPHVAHLYSFLNERDIPTSGLSGSGNKATRQRAVEDFKKGKTRLLVATDAVARGLDIQGLQWVIHYEMARTAQTYLHRAGRTGRAGAEGHSVVMVAPAEAHLLRRYATDLHIDFTWPER